MKKDY